MTLGRVHFEVGAESSADIMPWKVMFCSWSAMGGPVRARLSARLPEGGGVDLLEGLLGRPAGIMDENGQAIWWGYVHGVQMANTETPLQMHLGALANRVRSVYTAIENGGTAGETRRTDWIEDAGSQERFGVYERLLLLGAASVQEAEARAKACLVESAWPAWEPLQSLPEGLKGEGNMLLDCRGWWQALGRRISEQPPGSAQHRVGKRMMFPLGDGAARMQAAQAVHLPSGGWRISSLELAARRAGMPADSLTVALCANREGRPGSVLASGELSGALFGEDDLWLRFTLEPAMEASEGETVWLVVSRSGAADAANHYRLRVDSLAGYAGGGLLVGNGEGWQAVEPPASLFFSLSGPRRVKAMLEAAGETGGSGFLEGVWIENAEDLFTPSCREGLRSCREEIEHLLQAMQGTGQRWLPVVGCDRILRICRRLEPAEGFREGNAGIDAGALPAGRWVHLKIPGGSRFTSPIWVEDVFWDYRNGTRVVFQR